MQEKRIKFVKKANQWVYTWWEREKGKNKQKQKWFSSKKEAEVFANSNEENNSK